MHAKGLFSTNASIALVQNTFYVSKITILCLYGNVIICILLPASRRAGSPAQLSLAATLRGQRKQPVSNWSRKL